MRIFGLNLMSGGTNTSINDDVTVQNLDLLLACQGFFFVGGLPSYP
jgi:hypothetical protein